jgi:hypothetical protein
VSNQIRSRNSTKPPNPAKPSGVRDMKFGAVPTRASCAARSTSPLSRSALPVREKADYTPADRTERDTVPIAGQTVPDIPAEVGIAALP